MDKCLCFTGHRHIKSGKKWADEALKNAVTRAAESGFNWFMSGGAPGYDWWFTDCAMVERWKFAGKPTVIGKGVCDVRGLPDGLVVGAAIPFPSFWDRYKSQSDDRIYLKKLENSLDIIVAVNEGEYAPWKMHARNQWLVDEACAILTVYDGRKKGGTFSTLKYARRLGKPIYWIDPAKRQERWVNT